MTIRFLEPSGLRLVYRTTTDAEQSGSHKRLLKHFGTGTGISFNRVSSVGLGFRVQ